MIRYAAALVVVFPLFVTSGLAQDASGKDRKGEYVRAVTRGAGLLPWQRAAASEAETVFRAKMEARKDALLERSGSVHHPAIYTEADLSRARANGASSAWAKRWVENQIALADYVVNQPSSWIESMIPIETPAHGYGFTCPVCVGSKSQEAVGYSLAGWSHTDPDVLTCTACGHRFPDPAYPETATLELPRRGERITYYLNDAERAKPDDRSGKLAWHWVGYPIHVSFTGLIRERKIGFMGNAAQSLAFAYAFTGKPDYAERARDILVRYARCYRNWAYRDYWDTYADCDPLYAAWHDKALPLEWKRHLCEDAFAKDTFERAGMLQSYWGAGRVHPSTDSISGLDRFALAYDLTCTARVAGGAPVWSDGDRRLVERDLLLEWMIGAEPFTGGENKAENANNKAPRVYSAMAAIAKCLGIPSFADTALRGYERVRDRSFMYDGFSKESPSYNNMYLSQLLLVPEMLHGFAWPADFTARSGVVDYYASDPLLRLMYRGVLWSLTHAGQYLPLSDSHIGDPPSDHILHMGLRRFPEMFEGTLPALDASRMTEYALFQLSEESLKRDTGLNLPETYFPAWQTAVLRHGAGPGGATLSMAFNYAGGHRHNDNLALFYQAGRQIVLGDLGYVGDMPVNAWIRSTFSHNLVIVDDAEQRHDGRVPEFGFMAVSPIASVVEATSTAYESCSEYRRRVALVKGPNGASFAVDVFRVAGGAKHAYRVFSEHAASSTENGELTFNGVTMPPEPPLPQVGASLARDDIYGLRDVRSAAPGSDAWQATWKDSAGAYRLWMLTACERVEAANGPGQRNLHESGRRVRVVDAVRHGEKLSSTFVAVHEPVGGFVHHAERLKTTGDRASAIRVETTAGTYYILHDFDRPAEIGELRFHGVFACALVADGTLKSWMTAGASEFAWRDEGFSNAQPAVACAVQSNDFRRVIPAALPENGWPAMDAGAMGYVRAKVDGHWTGFPIASVGPDGVATRDFPLPQVEAVEVMAVRYGTAG